MQTLLDEVTSDTEGDSIELTEPTTVHATGEWDGAVVLVEASA